MAGSPFLAFLAGAGLASAAGWFPRLMILAAVLLVIHLLKKRNVLYALLLFAGALLVLTRPPVPAPEPGAFGYSPLMLGGYFVSPPKQISGGYSQRFRIINGAKGMIDEVDVLSGRAFEVGQGRALMARLVAPRRKLNPGTRRSEPFAFLEDAGPPMDNGGIIMTPQVTVNRIRARLDREIERLFPPEEAALVAAVTTSGRLPGAKEIREDFRRSGLAHLFSISGTHFGFFALVLFGLFKVLLTLLPRLTLERLTEFLTPSEAAALLTFPFMLGYLFLSGARVPSVRAFIMTGMFLAGLMLGRRGGWFPFLWLAATLIVLFDPQALGGLSFQMSFLAVLFIGALIWPQGDRASPPPLEAETMAAKAARYAWGLVLITLAASLGLMPLVAYYFHYFSLVSPAANFIVGPLVSMVLVPFSLLGAGAYIVTGYYITWPVVLVVARASVWLASFFASAPYSSVTVPAFPAGLLLVYYAGFALWFWRRRWLFLAAPALSVLVFVLINTNLLPLDANVSKGSTNTMRVTFPDAGRADAAIIELLPASGGAGYGETLVVDTGRRGHEVAAYLKSRGIETIDALIITHAHADHAGGIGRLSDEFKVLEIWDGGWVDYSSGVLLNGIPRRTLRRGDVIDGKGFSLQVLHPYEGFVSTEEGPRAVNERSLVFRLIGDGPDGGDGGGNASFLFTGDIGGEAARNILEIPPRWLKADVLKAPHHGLGAEELSAMLKASGARIVVASAPRLYNAARAVKAQGNPDTEYYVTGVDGAVSFYVSDGQIKASAYSDYRLVIWPSLTEEVKNARRLFASWPSF